SKKLRTPFLATADFEKLADHAEEFPFFIRMSANEEYPPYIFGPDLKPVQDQSQVYGGRWAKIGVRAYAYDAKGNKGVSFGLSRVQLLDDADPIGGGRVATAEGFEAVNVAGKPKNADAVWDDDKSSKKPAGGRKGASAAADTGDLDDEIP